MGTSARDSLLMAVAAFWVATGAGDAGRFGGRDQGPSFSTESNLVVLDVAVSDARGAPVTGLDAQAFAVAEDGVPQAVSLFSATEVPATIGLVIDDSASMFGAQPMVAAAGEAFVQTSHTADEIFALLFNEHARSVLPSAQPFTSDPATLRAGLQAAMAARGRTALYDAVLAAMAYAAEGTHARKAIVVLGDGGDNASTRTLADVRQAAEASPIAVYAVVTRDPADRDSRPGVLRELATLTGGVAFDAKAPTDIGKAFTAIARDIRSRYTVAYVPPSRPPGLRQIQVFVRDPQGHLLRVRTRTAYRAR